MFCLFDCLYIMLLIYSGGVVFTSTGMTTFTQRPCVNHARVILSCQQPTFQKSTKTRQLSYSRFKCRSFFQVNF